MSRPGLYRCWSRHSNDHSPNVPDSHRKFKHAVQDFKRLRVWHTECMDGIVTIHWQLLSQCLVLPMHGQRAL
eukprot:1699089-Rhodomonas_salina.1